MKFFERYDKAYCISLKRRQDRRDAFDNEVKKYDQNLIQIEKFSPYNEYNDNYQLDEEIFGSILLSYVP